MATFNKDSILRIVGLGLCKNWFAISGFSLSSSLAQTIDLYTLAFLAVFLFLAAIFYKKLSAVFTKNIWIYPLAGVLACLATLFPLLSFIEPLLLIFSSVCAGICLGIILLAWGTLFCNLQLQTLLKEVFLAILTMLLLHLLYVLVPGDLGTMYRGACILLSGFFLAGAIKDNASYGSFIGKRTIQTKQQFHYCIRFFIAINVLALVINWMYNFYRFNDLDFFGLQQMPAILIQVLYIAVLAFASVRKRIRVEHLYIITVATTVISFLLLPLFGLNSPAPLLMLFIGFLSLDILIFVLSARICTLFSAHPIVVFGIGQGSFLGLQIVIARSLIATYFPFEIMGSDTLSLVTLIGVVLVGLAYFGIFNGRLLYQAIPEEASTVTSPPSLNTSPISDDVELWEAFCVASHLTKREGEVLSLFAQGRSYTRIQELLFISRGTVNYHVNNAYRKLGCSSRQELLDLIEAFKEEHP